MRILEICPFSSGICGVWTRVKQEALELSKEGNEVFVFSSNRIKGSNGTASCDDEFGDVKIKRFKTKYNIPVTESYMIWDYKSLKKSILDLKPNVIIAHGYRHTHTHIALDVGKKIGAKVFLVTHAPFVPGDKIGRLVVEGESTRSLLSKYYVRLFDKRIGKNRIKQFDKIIAISRWEIPFLEELGVKRDKIEYIPNGIPEEFFSVKKGKEENKILFFGRISPIKDIETLIKAFYLIRDKEIKLEIAGPAEKDYLLKLKELIKEFGLEKRVLFTGAVYGLNDKIKKIDSAKLFVLPSKREAMPQALIEVMAREKIVIASANLGAKDIIRDGKNGFLFEIGNENALSALIEILLNGKNEKVKKEARKSVEQFNWNRIIGKIKRVIES